MRGRGLDRMRSRGGQGGARQVEGRDKKVEEFGKELDRWRARLSDWGKGGQSGG
jgi:hypothetical protein